jgi:hypothetical protein
MRKSILRLSSSLLVLMIGLALSACSLTTDPTKGSSDSTSSSGGGKSETKKDGVLKEDQRVNEFATVNFDKLKEDMAAGRGEHLASLATLLGVTQEHQTEFFTFTKEKFPLLFASERATADEMLATLTREMASHPTFHTIVAQR